MSFTRAVTRIIPPSSPRSIYPAIARNSPQPTLHFQPQLSFRRMSHTQDISKAPPLQEKVAALTGYLDKHKFLLLTTRAPDGSMHARTMAPAERTKDLRFKFIYDNTSYKETELDNDAHVNLASDATESNDGWVSIAGKARRVTDEDAVAKLYNPTIKAWFGDKGDGVHNGEPNDPRMAVLEVTPSEIRHYHQTSTTLGFVAEVARSTFGGDTAKVGEIRTITKEELAGL